MLAGWLQKQRLFCPGRGGLPYRVTFWYQSEICLSDRWVAAM
jgi:hypothetical protein